MSSPVDKAQEFWKKHWKDMYSTPRAWAHKGENLIHAFEAVANSSISGSMHFDMLDQALMLAGMAVEVQLKAILINMPAVKAVVTAPKKPITPIDKHVRDAFYSHSLADLAETAGITLTKSQLKTAEALTQYIYWRGRYVIPRESGIADLVPVKLGNGFVGQNHHVTIEEARNLIKRIIAEVKTRLYA